MTKLDEAKKIRKEIEELKKKTKILEAKSSKKATKKAEAKLTKKATKKAEAKPTKKATKKAEAKPTKKATKKAEAKPTKKATKKAEAKPTKKATKKAEAKPTKKATKKAEAKLTKKATKKAEAKPEKVVKPKKLTKKELEINEIQDQGLNSWENCTKEILEFLDTLPNHIRIQINTKLFDGPVPKNQELFDSGMEEFSNEFHIIAIQEPKIIEEWEKIYHKPENQFSNLLSGVNQKVALQNYIAAELHPRFVYFSDYKKIYGNINLNEYLRKENRTKSKILLNLLKNLIRLKQ